MSKGNDKFLLDYIDKFITTKLPNESEYSRELYPQTDEMLAYEYQSRLKSVEKVWHKYLDYMHDNPKAYNAASQSAFEERADKYFAKVAKTLQFIDLHTRTGSS